MYLEILRKIRELKGLSQREFGELIGLEQFAYCKIENGTIQLNVTTLLNICNELKVSVNDILNQYPLQKDVSLTYKEDSFEDKLMMYNKTIDELERLVNEKQSELQQLKQSRDALVAKNEQFLKK